MPYAPLGPCRVPGCPNRSNCAVHAVERAPDTRPSASQRGYGRDWKVVRDKHLREYPWCAVCGQTGTDVDHIVPRKQGGTDAPGNLQTLCHVHHSRKTARRDGGFGNKARAHG